MMVPAKHETGARAQVVILGFSGDLDSSVALVRLLEKGSAVVTLTLDIGQGNDMEEVRARALALGALRAHVLDGRDDFARDCILPALQSGTFHDAQSPISRIAHPLIARKLVEVATIEKAAALAHGGGASDHASINAAVMLLDPRLEVVPVIVDSGMSRDELAVYARERAISVPADSRRRHRPGRQMDVPAHVEVRFEAGVPVSVNDVAMPLVELLESIQTIAVDHGIGGSVQTPPVTASEAPGAVVLAEAYSVLNRGAVTSPTGVVCVRLFQGAHRVVGHTPVALR